MSKSNNGFPYLESLLSGLTPERARDLESLYHEDIEAYQRHVDRLSELGAVTADYESVNGAVKREMYEVSRGDRNIQDAAEMETRVMGRTYSAEGTTDLRTAAEVAVASFRKAKRETGWRGPQS